jgi:hypothetical protein
MNESEQQRIIEGAPQTPAIWSDAHTTLVLSPAPRSPSRALSRRNSSSSFCSAQMVVLCSTSRSNSVSMRELRQGLGTHPPQPLESLPLRQSPSRSLVSPSLAFSTSPLFLCLSCSLSILSLNRSPFPP